MNYDQANEITGGLSKPSKMPCPSYNLPTTACKTGSKLKKIKGSVCNKCYAKRGHYLYGCVQKSLKRKLKAIKHPDWVEAMSLLIRDYRYFRWHDSGDIQSTEHLQKIIEICKNTPHTLHWLPTKEQVTVEQIKEEIPENLIVRIAAYMIDSLPPDTSFPTCTVHKLESPIGVACGAIKGRCNECRNCWDRSISNISYQYH